MWQLNANIIDYLPDWFKNILDMQEICQSEGEQFELLAQAINNVADNFFFQTMDEGAVQQWEQIFSIVANPETETLAFRRARLLNRVSTQPPFTLQFLYNKLDQLIGAGQYTITVDYPNYTLYVESSAANQFYATEIAYTIGKIKPAHIVYINKPYAVQGVALGETVALAELVWNYKLGTWGLGLAPFASTVQKEVIIVPSNYSIEQELLNDTAQSVSTNVASAQVNGNIAISGLTKSVSANVAQFQYTVTEADTTLVTQIALLDSSGNVLTTSPVYVPITGDTIFTHKITVTAQEANANG